MDERPNQDSFDLDSFYKLLADSPDPETGDETARPSEPAPPDSRIARRRAAMAEAARQAEEAAAALDQSAPGEEPPLPEPEEFPPEPESVPAEPESVSAGPEPASPPPDLPDPAADTAQKPSGKRGRKKRRRKILLTVLAVLLFLIAALSAVGLHYYRLWQKGEWHPSQELKQFIMSITDSDELMEHARDLKADVKDLAAALKSEDVDGAEKARARMREDIDKTQAFLSSPLWKTATITPGIGKQLRSVNELLLLLEDADEGLIGPYIEHMTQYPLSRMNSKDGIRVDVLLHYLEFMERIMPEAEALLTKLNTLDLSILDENGKMAEFTGQLTQILGAGARSQEFLPTLRMILGNGADRLYVFAAQNTSEIRASGGFPGSVGIIRIRDGLLTISDFESVYNVFECFTPPGMYISEVEDKIFSGRLHVSWDADFSPDFERVASIWAHAYRYRQGEALDGVISGTPAIIQRMLAFLGDVTLSDGTVLTGDNASRVLGHDLYFKYLGTNMAWNANEYVDQLFSESARKTLDLLLSHVDVTLFADYLSFFQQSIADRTLMVWMADGQEQEMVRSAGWSAGLNHDPMHPQAGVFFNSTVASKMAWFLDIVPEISAPTVNADGSRSYDLTVTFSNVMTEEERRNASYYILGETNGITGSVYLFAPAGGSISDMHTNIDRSLLPETYEDFALGYMIDVTIRSSSPLVLTCRITTAPGADEPLGLIVTPTMQQYR